MRLQLLTCQPGTWVDSQGQCYNIVRFLWHRLDCFVRIVHGVGDSMYVCTGQRRVEKVKEWPQFSWSLCMEWRQGAQPGNLNHLWASQKVVLGQISGHWDIK